MKAPTLPFLDIYNSVLLGHMGRADLVLNACEKWGGIVKVPIPFKDVYFVASPSAVKHITIDRHSNYAKSDDYKILAQLLGQGLLSSDDEKWKADRLKIQPIFKPQNLLQFQKTIFELTQKMILEWKTKKEVSLLESFTELALVIIGKWILDLDVREYAPKLTEIIDLGQKRIIEKGWAVVDISKWYKTSREIKFQKDIRDLRSLMKELMAASPLTENCLLTLLKNHHYPEEAIIDHLITFFLTGHETTAVALTWLFYGLSQEPEIQTRLHKEIRNRSFDPLNIHSQTPYTQQVIEESLRLYPTAPFMGRINKEDDIIDGFEIKKNSTLALCPYATHRNHHYWKNPLQFDPERFSSEQKSKIEMGSYFPFGLGPRKCIGMSFAQLEIGIMLEELIRHFKFSLTSDSYNAGVIPLVSMKPNKKISVILENWDA